MVETWRYPDKPGRTAPWGVPPDVAERPSHWAAEIKWDGWRSIVRLQAGAAPVVRSRMNEPLPDFADELAEELLPQLDASCVVLDAELMGRRRSGEPRRFWLLDVWEIDGISLYNEPRDRRRLALEGLAPPELLVEATAIGDDFKSFMAAARRREREGAEGLVYKRRDSVLACNRRQSAENIAWVRCKWVMS